MRDFRAASRLLGSAVVVRPRCGSATVTRKINGMGRGAGAGRDGL